MSDFENMRLEMMLEQYPQAGWMNGMIVFYADEDEHRISHTTWSFEDLHFDWLSESGFKLHLMELLDQFIQYRGSHSVKPKREGIVRLGDGKITIEWLGYGSSHFTNHDPRHIEDK